MLRCGWKIKVARKTENRLQETISLLNATLNQTADGLLVVRVGKVERLESALRRDVASPMRSGHGIAAYRIALRCPRSTAEPGPVRSYSYLLYFIFL